MKYVYSIFMTIIFIPQVIAMQLSIAPSEQVKEFSDENCFCKIGISRADAIATIITCVTYKYTKPIACGSGPVIGKLFLDANDFSTLPNSSILLLYLASQTKKGSPEWKNVATEIKKYPKNMHKFIRQGALLY